MFFHSKGLQFEAKPSQPDAAYARKLQEVLGGQWGEISVMMTYLLQGWSCRMPGKYKDMILDIGTEEMAHVEMLATLIGKLLEDSPLQTEQAANSDPAVAAVLGGMNPQHAIVSGLGAQAADSNGVPWNGRYAVSSGNLLADFRYNVTAESQGRLQVARLYQMTDDRGVRDTLAFLLARDTMHQNQWLAAIADLEREGLEETPVPHGITGKEHQQFSYQFWNVSSGTESREGSWAAGSTPDGKGEFTYLEDPSPGTGEPTPPKPAPQLFVTGNLKGMASGLVDKAKDKLS